MSIRSVVLASIAGGVLALPASAQVINWASPIDGSWGESYRWQSGNIPDNVYETAQITFPNVIHQNFATLAVGGINILHPGATFVLHSSNMWLPGTGIYNEGLVTLNGSVELGGAFSNGSTGRLNIYPGQQLTFYGPVINNNLITIQGSGTPSVLRFNGPITVDGNGEITNNAFNTYLEGAGTNPHLTLGAYQTLRSIGGTLMVVLPMTNNGLVYTDGSSAQLQLSSNSKTNNGVIRAANNSQLTATATTITQSTGGRIEANDAIVNLFNTTISGGTLATSGSGVIRLGGGPSCTLANVASNGALQVLAGTTCTLSGSIVNHGVLTVNTPTGGAVAALRVESSASLNGYGRIKLDALGSLAQLTGTGHLSVGPDQTIEGTGEIQVGLTNSGRIAGSPGSTPLQLTGSSKVNNGVITSQAAPVRIVNTTITQTSNGVIEAPNASITFQNANLTGGTVRSSGDGFITTTSTSLFRSVKSAASIRVDGGAMLRLDGGLFTNNGTITVNPFMLGSSTSLRVEGDLTIDGVGAIHLPSSHVGSLIQQSPSNALLTLGPGQTLTGIGLIDANLAIEGVVSPGNGGIGALIGTSAKSMTWQPGSLLKIEIGSPFNFDYITATHHTINGGTIDVTLLNGYTPNLFDTFIVLHMPGGTFTGRFDAVNGPALPDNWVWKAALTSQGLAIGVTCPSDYNTDFTVDVMDLLDFVNDFGTCANQPLPCGAFNLDHNNDGAIDILDFLDFIDNFGSGC